MRIPLTALLCTAGALHAQGDLLYYKFDSADGGKVLNFGTAGTPAMAFGKGPSYRLPGGLTTGAFGTSHALASSMSGVAGNTVDTGFTGGINGSMTIALAMRNRFSNSPLTVNGLLGRPDFELSSGDNAGNSLILRGWGGPDLTFRPAAPICSMPGWNHFAVVVDGPGKQALWYVNGALAQATAITVPVNIAPNATAAVVGRDWQTHCGAYYDLDEVRLSDRAVPAAEIAAWSRGTTAVTAVFGADVNRNTVVDLKAVGGTPHFGNNAFGLRIAGAPAGAFGLAISLRRLPAPLAAQTLIGAEGFLHIGTDLLVLGGLDSTGKALLALPIPKGQGSLVVYSQAVVFGSEVHLAMTPALAHAVTTEK